MLTKRPAPLTGKLKNSIMSGGFRDSSSVSRKNHSEYCKILSPRGLINYDLDGIGLGIVAAMEKYVDDGTQLPDSKLFCRPDCNRSNPIPVKSPKKSTENRGVIIDENEENSLKDYTFVTGIIGNNNKTFDRDGENQRRDLDRRRSTKNNKPSMFIFSPVGFEDFTDYPDSDFLSSCHMCRKKLHGKDIYMYRGEKAFCSTECRYRQIKMDEKKKEEEEKAKEKEKFKGYEFGSRSVQLSSSSCNNNGRIFSPRILAI